MKHVHTIGQNLLLHLSLDTFAGGDGLQLDTQCIGEFATFGQQLLTHFGHCVAFEFAIYKYVIHNLLFPGPLI